MKHFIARTEGHVAVVSAVDEIEATRLLNSLFAAARAHYEQVEVLEFDPTVEGGVLLDTREGREVARK